MKVTKGLIDKLIALKSGKSLPYSGLKGEWVEEMIRDGILVSSSKGSKRTLKAVDGEAFAKAITRVDERLSDLELMRKVFIPGAHVRAEQASESGNSKLVSTRSCPGFPVNTYDSIACMLNGKEFVVNPANGSFLFISDWQSFTIPQDVVVMGIENMENFRMIRLQRNLFAQCIGSRRLLFVSRYPQSNDLRSWLQTIPNRYIHFGDFDLAGINIFLTEFHAYLGDRASFLIPSDIEQRLPNGSMERYNNQYAKFKHVTSEIKELQSLIDSINKHHRCYDQEGYINI